MDRKFKEIKQFDFAALERDVLDRWAQREVFDRSVSQREGAPAFVFYEGPPTANGRPGIHHVMARTIKDTFCRYKTMKGFRVERKGGWDTHGLPVEIEVEKELSLEGRHQVEAYGIEKYNAACRASVMRYKDLWDQITVRMGYWVDLDSPYVTFENEYIESVWWLLKQMYHKGLLYKGHKIQWYSPGSNTVLSSHEVSLGYKEVQDPSVYIRFPLADEADTYFLAWTTTPWTLISNAALAVGPKVSYVKIQVGPGTGPDEAEYLILAEDRLEVIKAPYTIADRYVGQDLAGKPYTPLFDYFVDDVAPGEAWCVTLADFVSTEDGTGIVHIAPAFGADDYLLGQREGLPVLNPVDPDGHFTDKAKLVAGDWFKDADKKVNRNLRDRGLLYRHESYLHNYPHDWRKGTPLISYPVESWFIRTTALKDRLVDLNRQINWQPKAIGTGRFGQWLENNVDWALSRNRYWGTPLPIWQSDAPGSDYVEMIGSVAELREKCGDQIPPDEALDLHRPYVDHYTWPAPDGGTMRRIPDLIDVWFDSGAMPYAQWHYPFENEDRFNESFPADFIAEGVDQTRGWFYTLHAIATLVSDSLAYRNVVVNGLLLDAKGEKMSKTKGNTVDPFEAIAEHGADPVRWYMMTNSPPWENLKWSDRGLRDTKRKFFSTLNNTYSFFATYANIDGFHHDGPAMPVAERAELDRWILSCLHTVITEVNTAYAAYNPTKAGRAIEGFVDDLSNWYIRRSRRRFWRSGHGDDKNAAYQTVYQCLMTVAKLMAPIAPFYADWLYEALNDATGLETNDSVHLADFPASDEALMDTVLMHQMHLARTIASVVLALRNEANLNVRQPLARILVVTGIGVEEADVEHMRGVVLQEVNIKTIEYVTGASDLVKKSAKPNFKVLGRRLGPKMKAVNAAVRALTSDEVDAYEATGQISLDLNGEAVVLEAGDLEVTSEGVEGWLVGQQGGVTVALDTNVTDDLRAEGLAREFVNRIQNLRKSAGYEVVDRVRVAYYASPILAEAIDAHATWIRNETLTDALEISESPQGDAVEHFEIGTQSVTVSVKKA